MKIQHAMVMSAGLGTRLQPFTGQVPKPMLPLLGVPTMQFAWDALAKAGVRTAVANVHHRAERAIQGMRDLDLAGVDLRISDESSKLLGSAGGIRKALSHFEGAAFYYLNADVLVDLDLTRLAAHHARLKRSFGCLITLALVARPTISIECGENYREIVANPVTDQIELLGEKRPNVPFFSGVAIIEPEALRNVPEGGPSEFVPTILAPAVKARRAGVYRFDSDWIDIGSPLLWWKAHLDFLGRLETGQMPLAWLARMQERSMRAGSEKWVGREVSARDRSQVAMSEGPIYFEGPSLLAPIGPAAVAYGSLTEPLGRGIAFNSMRVLF